MGFRPFIYRLAKELELTGWVLNSSQGVVIEAEGRKEQLDNFLLRIGKEKPQHAFIQSLEPAFFDKTGYASFEILESSSGEKTAIILPDIATCPDCLKDVFNSSSRRYLYPFTNCTNCGPRYSIIESLPYDRPNTTMKGFSMCPHCAQEYNNPQDRRFHAQPNACPECGPYVSLWDKAGAVAATHQEAMAKTAQGLRDGLIVAVKGLGGFHLMADARNEEAVKNLRYRKNREAKPLALMYPSLEAIQSDCALSDYEERLLSSSEAPIVLVRKRVTCSLPESIAPDNPYLGVMIPYTPLHHILMRMLNFPVVATSGNMSDETICFQENEALKYLSSIADIFLVHNRPIARHVDDSIVRIFSGREIMMRRARGYAPLPVMLKSPVKDTMLAVGGHLKNTIAVSSGKNVFISQHIGDLDTEKTFNTFNTIIDDFRNMYELDFKKVVCDLHPRYRSTQFALHSGLPVLEVQHHYAHVLSCMAENELTPPVLGVCWDGTGYGTDRTVWGGEFLKINDKSFERVAYFKPFYLPGANKAVREPRRTALGLLYEIFGEDLFEMRELNTVKAFTDAELKNMQVVLEKKINSPLTSSAGRLFDAVASIIGVRQIAQFEGQAAMALEFLTIDKDIDQRYSLVVKRIDPDYPASAFCVDHSVIIKEILIDLEKKIPKEIIAAKFHNTLTEIIITVAKGAGMEKVVLSGGCFQNKYLTEHTVKRLRQEKFLVYWHQRVPPNDGGISLGQIAAACKE